MVLLRSAIYGTTAVLGPPDRDDVTIASMVPTQLARLLDSPPPADAARGAARRRAATRPLACSRRRLAGRADLRPHAGLLGGDDRRGRRHETSGRALPGVDVAIAPDGEILVDGPTVAGGGTLRTGDLGRLDDRGRLIVIGRKADTIVSGGENVAPAEVEAVLLEHPAVAEAGVFARPHPEWGEAVTARVVLRSRRHRGRAARLGGRAARALQGPEDDRGRRRAPAHGLRQAAAEGAGMTLPRREPPPLADRRRRLGEARRRHPRATRCRSRAGCSTRSRRSPATSCSRSRPAIGDTGFLAAELIEPGGTLITSDLVPEMLTAAQRRAETLGITNVALPPDRRRGDRPAGREPRRRAVALGLHADAGRRGRAQRHAARAARPAAASRSPPGATPTTTRGPSLPVQGAASSAASSSRSRPVPASSPGRPRARPRRTSTRPASSSTRSSRCPSRSATRPSKTGGQQANDISLRVQERASRCAGRRDRRSARRAGHDRGRPRTARSRSPPGRGWPRRPRNLRAHVLRQRR